MKLKVTLTVQPFGSETPKLTQEMAIDSSAGIIGMGAQLSGLLAAIWQEVRAREAEFKKAVGQ